jgi:hypothetical protein
VATMKNWPLRVLLYIDLILLGMAIYTGHATAGRNDFSGLIVVVYFLGMALVSLLAYVILLGSTLRYASKMTALHKFGLLILLALFSLPALWVVIGETGSTTLIALYILTLAIQICLIPVKRLYARLLFVSRLAIVGLTIIDVASQRRYDGALFWVLLCVAILVAADLYGLFRDYLKRYLLPTS